MGIPLSSNFNLNAGLPLDNRVVVQDMPARDALPAIQRYDGLPVYVLSEKKTYQLQGGIANSDWKLIGDGVDSITAIAFTYDAQKRVATQTVTTSNAGDIVTTYTYQQDGRLDYYTVLRSGVTKKYTAVYDPNDSTQLNTLTVAII